MQGAYQLLFEVTSSASGQPQLVDSRLVRIEQQLAYNRSTGEFQRLQLAGSQGLAILTLPLMVTCQSGVATCVTDSSCVPRDDLFGHYTCGAGGEIVCLPGFQDPASYCIEESQSVGETTPTESSEPLPQHSTQCGSALLADKSVYCVQLTAQFYRSGEPWVCCGCGGGSGHRGHSCTRTSCHCLHHRGTGVEMLQEATRYCDPKPAEHCMCYQLMVHHSSIVHAYMYRCS